VRLAATLGSAETCSCSPIVTSGLCQPPVQTADGQAQDGAGRRGLDAVGLGRKPSEGGGGEDQHERARRDGRVETGVSGAAGGRDKGRKWPFLSPSGAFPQAVRWPSLERLGRRCASGRQAGGRNARLGSLGLVVRRRPCLSAGVVGADEVGEPESGLRFGGRVRVFSRQSRAPPTRQGSSGCSSAC